MGNIFVHMGTTKKGSIEVGGEVEAAVDAKLRQQAKVHHTATHLLQAALKKVIGQEASQAGSLVAFDRLRFDFNFHRPLLDNELMEIEGLINSWIEDSTLLQTKVMPLTDAKKAGAIAMFGEKYGEQVQVSIKSFLLYFCVLTENGFKIYAHFTTHKCCNLWNILLHRI